MSVSAAPTAGDESAWVHQLPCFRGRAPHRRTLARQLGAVEGPKAHHGGVRPEAKALDTSSGRRVGKADLNVASVGDTTITREVMAPGWKWSVDVKPVVGTDLCRALHQLFIVSGRLHVVMEDGAEIDFGTGDAGVIPPGHDALRHRPRPCQPAGDGGTLTVLRQP